jgi:hypothetical protein
MIKSPFLIVDLCQIPMFDAQIPMCSRPPPQHHPSYNGPRGSSATQHKQLLPGFQLSELCPREVASSTGKKGLVGCEACYFWMFWVVGFSRMSWELLCYFLDVMIVIELCLCVLDVF